MADHLIEYLIVLWIMESNIEKEILKAQKIDLLEHILTDLLRRKLAKV